MFSIYICSHNSELRLLSRVLKSCLNNRHVHQISVVANGYTIEDLDRLKCYLDREFSSIKLLVSKSGVMNARKLSILDCETDWLLFVDDDNILSATFTAQIMKAIQDNPAAVVFGGLNLLPKRFESLVDSNVGLVKSLLACDDWASEEIARVNQVPTAGMCISRKIAKAIVSDIVCSGRERGNLMSGEDTEICFKALQYGQILKVPKATLLHAVDRSRLNSNYLQKLGRKMTTTLCYLHFVFWRNLVPRKIAILLSMLSSLAYIRSLYFIKPTPKELMQDYRKSVSFMLQHKSD